LAIAGVIISAMGVSSAMGMLLLFDMDYNEICNVMPLIVLCKCNEYSYILCSSISAIGVDEMFILSSAWHQTRVTHSPIDRMSESLAHAAVSITITSVTGEGSLYFMFHI
jgi:hypothetical protein